MADEFPETEEFFAKVNTFVNRWRNAGPRPPELCPTPNVNENAIIDADIQAYIANGNAEPKLKLITIYRGRRLMIYRDEGVVGGSPMDIADEVVTGGYIYTFWIHDQGPGDAENWFLNPDRWFCARIVRSPAGAEAGGKRRIKRRNSKKSKKNRTRNSKKSKKNRTRNSKKSNRRRR